MSEETVALPYVALLQGRVALDVLRASPGLLEELLHRLPQDGLNTPTAPGKWSLREIVCHIADCEIAWSWRFRQTYGEDRPVLQPFEQDPWARAYAGPDFTLPRALETWQTLRAWNVAFLGTLTEADWARVGLHPEDGPRTLKNLAEIAAGHDLHHLALLEKRVAAAESKAGEDASSPRARE